MLILLMALGASTFHYTGRLHEMKHASSIEHCGKRNCFLAMVTGLLITALVRFMVSVALAIHEDPRDSDFFKNNS